MRPPLQPLGRASRTLTGHQRQKALHAARTAELRGATGGRKAAAPGTSGHGQSILARAIAKQEGYVNKLKKQLRSPGQTAGMDNDTITHLKKAQRRLVRFQAGAGRRRDSKGRFA